MSGTRRIRKVSNIETERLIQSALRHKGWLIPTTVEQVQKAEAAIAKDEVQLPESLLRPPDLAKCTKLQTRTSQKSYWTHDSVLLFARDRDPIETVTQRARETVMRALELGWSGPPYDPFALAELLRIRVVPTQEVVDARTTASASGNFTLEFNPTRPPARIRYSVAHEIAHTLFPDCAAAVRHRGTHSDMAKDEWQLEMLCNLAASEILMPLGSLAKENDLTVSVDAIGKLRKKYQVSSEAVLLRLTRLTERACVVFAARRDPGSARYYVDYSIASRSWKNWLRPGFALPKLARVHECTAIGYTAKGLEQWLHTAEECYAEYLGIPAYLGQTFPRVLGIVSPKSPSPEGKLLIYLKGDATVPRGRGHRLIVQLVNDKALTWGAGFAKSVRTKWPTLQTRFTEWVQNRDPEFRLGGVHFTEIEPTLHLASVVAQHGYGPSPKPRIRYKALAECLHKVARFAIEHGSSVHMPRIGTGQSGGSWDVVSEIVDESLCGLGIEVFVYDLPHGEVKEPNQQRLF
jgi:Zn-dependent peptidase ImmA (M78 family)/O-acetyl-ADP-ribose deacetylase (regulator of RNase III)